MNATSIIAAAILLAMLTAGAYIVYAAVISMLINELKKSGASNEEIKNLISQSLAETNMQTGMTP